MHSLVDILDIVIVYFYRISIGNVSTYFNIYVNIYVMVKHLLALPYL